jgi:hypothetical protein
LERRSATTSSIQNRRKTVRVSNAADANKIAVPLARKVCEIFHVFATTNNFDNFKGKFHASGLAQ